MSIPRVGAATRKSLAMLILGLLLAISAFAAEAARSYTVVLDAPAVGRRLPRRLRALDGRVRTEESEFRALRRQVLSAQEPIKAALRGMGAEVTGSVCHVLNAVFVRATREQASRLRSLSGVKRVVPSPRFKLLLDAAGQIVRAPAAWNVLGGFENVGAGWRIGIIDTGIDPDHPALQDPALAPPPGFPKGRPEDLPLTSNKVIVARSYVRLLNPEDPAFSRPDDTSPRDRVGHGTAVATIAAGRRVNAPAATLTGIAPKAFLGNYKIFGAPDINEFSNANAVISAIDDAVTDGMDIISISFGAIAQFPHDEQGVNCSDDPSVLCDPVATAAQSAVEDFGVVVVAAAGNGGAFGEQHFPALDSIATPGSAPAAITVGATVNSRQFVRSVRFGGQTVTAISGTGPKPDSPLTTQAVDVAALGNPFACTPFASSSLDGLVAVIARGECDFEFKVANAADAGAVGAVVTNVEGEDEPFVMVGLETTEIPAFMIGNGAGNDLRSALQVSPATPVTLDPALIARSIASDQVAPFSSRGPSPSDDIKPDLVAPGTFIYAGAQRFDSNGDTFDSTGYASVDGTSFAAPMVAGAAALVKQRHPEFTAAQVKSALVNTAAMSVIENGELARVTSVGAGLLDIAAALDPIATAEPATISFGAVGGVALPLESSLTITNIGTSQATFRVTVDPRDVDPNAGVVVSGATSLNLQLAAGNSTTVPVTLEGSTPPPGNYEGVIRVRDIFGEADIRIPFYYTVGDEIPFNSFVIAGTGVVGTVNEPHPELLIFRVTDRYGQPVAGLSVQFNVVAGGGSIFLADSTTDPFGVAAADVDMGPEVGFQDYEALAGGLRIPFLNAARQKPAIGGIVNGATFAAERAVAPGSIISIFGQLLAEFVGEASRLPLPIALKHVSVSFDFPEEEISIPAPFFFASPEQLNIQVPWELAGLNFALVKARIEDSASALFALDLADYAPGIFEWQFQGQTLGIVTHADGTLVTPQNPARPGETVVVYATGVGPVDLPQITGQPASSTQLARTRTLPIVRVSGSDAAVAFSGLTPGFVGLYQLNVTLPASLQMGDLQLVVISNGIESNSVTLLVR